VAREIAARFSPSELIDIVEMSDVARLTSLLGRDAGQMTRLLAYLADRPELYGLEAVVFEDHLEITMYDHDVPKPINQLSKGQMATALLPLILRPASYPLIFDQPEDDLDNSFIYDTLVSEIKELKSTRQLIFVTHNANIPVLGEADAVVVMEMATPRTARAPAHGSVDQMKEHILRLLEGGAEAFRCRQQRYRSLLDE
jgi:ABC-type glutathione transport system ATPase component